VISVHLLGLRQHRARPPHHHHHRRRRTDVLPLPGHPPGRPGPDRSDGTILDALRLVRDAIVAADNPRSTLSNFSGAKSITLPRAIARSEWALSHDTLDEHAGRHSVEHLRSLLALHTGAMPVGKLPDLSPAQVAQLQDALLANADALLTSARAVLDLGHVALASTTALDRFAGCHRCR